MSTERKTGRQVEGDWFEGLVRRQPIVRKYNEVVYKPMQAEAFEMLEPLERAEQVLWLADNRRMGAALAIANLVEADIQPRPDELDAFALVSKEWREALEQRDRLRDEAQSSEDHECANCGGPVSGDLRLCEACQEDEHADMVLQAEADDRVEGLDR